jgi:hypothetical protein
MDANSRNCSSSQQHDRTHRTQETPTPASGQASLHDPGGCETTPARGTEGSTPFAVCVGLEATRSYPAGSGAEAAENLGRAAADVRAGFLTALDPVLRSILNFLEFALRLVELHPRRRR